MKLRQRVLIQIYGSHVWHIGRVISVRRQEIKITEGPMKNLICPPALTWAWKRTP